VSRKGKARPLESGRGKVFPTCKPIRWVNAEAVERRDKGFPLYLAKQLRNMLLQYERRIIPMDKRLSKKSEKVIRKMLANVLQFRLESLKIIY